tara:strand:- start:2048 stop:3073 length:1026 start_codon:yes stop_codon:yes gene_type:complete
MDLKKLLMMDYASKNQGGGLFGSATQGGGLFGNFSNINPNIILGSMIAGGGIQGKDPFSSFAPALFKTGQLQSQFAQMNEMQKKASDREKKRKFFELLPEGSPYRKVAESGFYDIAASEFLKGKATTSSDAIKAAKEAKNFITSQENILFDKYSTNKTVQAFNESSVQLKKMLSALEEDTGAGDVAAVFAFMKTLDPSSVVRESEFEVAESTRGTRLLQFEDGWQVWNKLKRGERLTTKQKEDYKKAAIGFWGGDQSAVDNIKSSYMKKITNQGLNSDNIFVDADIRPSEIDVTIAQGPAKQHLKQIKQKLPMGTKLIDYAQGYYYFELPDGRKFRTKGLK